MAFDVFVDCSKDRARWALMQFALRRGMRIVEPWYLDGVRIEGPTTPSRGGWEGRRPSWGDRVNTFLLNWPSDRPAVDIEFSRKKGRTVVRLSPGSREDCLMLAHRIEAYLRDEAARAVQSPAVCPTCQAPVEIVTANYCARCGRQLSMSAADYPPQRRQSGETDRVAVDVEETLPASSEAARSAAPEASACGEVVIEREDKRDATVTVSERTPANGSSGRNPIERPLESASQVEQHESRKRPVRERNAEAEAVVDD